MAAGRPRRDGEPWLFVGATSSSRIGAQKKSLRAAEQDRADVARAREEWRAGQGGLNPERMVFIDETGASTKMTEALRPMSARGATCLSHATRPLENNDLCRRSAPRWLHSALRFRRPHDWRKVSRLGRAVPRSNPSTRRIFVMDNLSSHKAMLSKRQSKPPARRCAISRRTRPTSTRSNRPSQSSNPCCAKLRHELPTRSSRSSPKLCKPSNGPNARTTSQIQDIAIKCFEIALAACRT